HQGGFFGQGLGCRGAAGGDVVAVDFEDGCHAAESGGGEAGGDFSRFAWEEREVVVVPKDRGHVVAAGTARGSEVDHEGDGLGRILDGGVNRAKRRPTLQNRGWGTHGRTKAYVQRDRREVVEAREVGEVFLRGV